MSYLDRAGWQETVEKLPEHSFFSTPLWGDVLEGSRLGYRCTSVKVDLGEMEVFIPFAEHRRFGLALCQSMPFGTYGGPLITSSRPDADAEACGRRLVAALKSRQRLGYLAVTPGPHPHLALPSPHQTYETDILDLAAGADALWKGFEKDARNQVRQAERAGVAVSVDNSEAGFRAYYEMLEASARRWGLRGADKPWSLFEAICRFAREDAVRLWLARVDGRPAAGALVFYGRGEVFYWSGAMHDEFRRARANNLIQWRVIEHAATSGYTDYNMGASGELGGVRAFKKQFGPRPRAYPSYVVRGAVWAAGRSLVRLRRLVQGGR